MIANILSAVRRLTSDDLPNLVALWLEACRYERSEVRDKALEDAAKLITVMTFRSPPELQWEMVLEAVRQAQSDDDLGHIAAGPIEGLLGWHGDACIGLVEQRAAEDPKFAKAMTGVWKYLMSDAVWARVEKIKAAVPPANSLGTAG